MDFVKLELDGQLAVITIDRPKALNALNRQVLTELSEAIGQVAANKTTRALIITGGGEKAFVAGADIAEMAGLSQAESTAFAELGHRVLDSLEHLPIPVIAAVNGFALGGGCELALCADRRIASTKAKLGLPEVTLGIMPGIGGTQRLPRLIGSSKAKDLIFTGRHVGAAEALEIGLVDEVVEPEDLMEQALLWAEQFRHAASWALLWAKEAIDTGLETDLDTGLMIEATGFASLFGTDDRRLGMKSFLEDGPGKASFRGH